MRTIDAGVTVERDRFRLTAEFLLLYGGIPLALWIRPELARGLMIPILLMVSLGMFLVLWRDPTFERRRLWGARGWSREMRSILTLFAVGASMLGFAFALAEPGRLFALPRHSPSWWLAICLLYPALSVYPQEIIFRVFLFHRYGALFPSERACILASALAFCAAHIFFSNWIAPVLSAIGGWLFARRYARVGVVLPVCVEHALWGDWLFTLGVGWYFYAGSIA